MEKTKKGLNEELKTTLIKTAIPIIMILLIEGIFGFLNGGILSVLNITQNAMLFSILIGYLIYGILIGVTKRLSISTIIMSIIGTIFLIINQMKIAYTGEIITFSDVNFIPKLNGIVSMITFEDVLILIRVYLLGFIILGILFFLIIKWTMKNDMVLNDLKLRCIITIICIIAFVILFIPNQNTKNIFLDVFLNADEGSYTTTVNYCDDYSLLSGIYGILLNERFYEPENYNEEELNTIILNNSTNKEEKENSYGKPNIILVFSESFWDIDKQYDVRFNKEVAPNIKRLEQEGKLIETLSCAYGRLSENIAFELLTGGSLNYFTEGYIPIMSLYKRKGSEAIPSIVKELKKNSYKSKIVFGEDYYNSEKTMKKLGFDEYIDIETPESIEDRNKVSDEYMTDLIIQELENKPKGEKILYMTETIQNHMPYKIDKYDKYDISVVSSNLSSEMNDTILSYAQGIYDADKQLNRLYEYIKQYDEPTIFIFLGDHLPYLYTETRKNALEYISYFNTGDELENIYRKYNTQALILSNYNINTDSIPQYLSYNLLLTYIVNNMDIELSSYYRWLYSTMEYLPATNSHVSVDKNGNKYYTKNLRGDMQIINKLRENMQYKFFIKPTK